MKFIANAFVITESVQARMYWVHWTVPAMITQCILLNSKHFYWSNSAFTSWEITRHPWKLLVSPCPSEGTGLFLAPSPRLLLQTFPYQYRSRPANHSSRQVLLKTVFAVLNVSVSSVGSSVILWSSLCWCHWSQYNDSVALDGTIFVNGNTVWTVK